MIPEDDENNTLLLVDLEEVPEDDHAEPVDAGLSHQAIPEEVEATEGLE